MIATHPQISIFMLLIQYLPLLDVCALTSHLSIFRDGDATKAKLFLAGQNIFDRMLRTENERIENEPVLIFLDSGHLLSLVVGRAVMVNNSNT